MGAPHDAVPQTAGILIFDGVEVLDFCGPFDVFSTASMPGDAPGEERRLFHVVTVAEARRLIRCHGGLLVMPHHDFSDHPPLDIVVIPGGSGARRERENPVALDWIARQHQRTAMTASVCTGAFLLAACGLLDSKRATTHWASIEWLRQQYPLIDVREGERVVDEGRVITSAGVSAGIDMALHVVARLFGPMVAAATARDMEYAWLPDSHRA
jgi:transcriptional regulator GlxA family with amidase domain